MKIKQLREITGLTQKKFSERFKIPLRTIQNWESETNTPPEYIPRLIEMQMILENENEQLRNGQMIFGAEEEQDPKQQPQEKEKLASNILSYLDDVEITCKDCIYDGKECRDQDCIIQNHRQYKEIVDLIARGAKK